MALFFTTGVRNNRELRRETLDVLCLLDEALGDEHREVGVLMASCLKYIVKGPPNFFPDGVSMRLDYHATFTTSAGSARSP